MIKYHIKTYKKLDKKRIQQNDEVRFSIIRVQPRFLKNKSCKNKVFLESN